jgi:NADPH:quinone reductase-like Zn-dependent oxidoreductase
MWSGSVEVAIHVHHFRLSWRPEGDFPIIPGTDISGVVEAAGDDVEGFAIGAAVYAMERFPEGMFGGSKTYADYVAVAAARAAIKPGGASIICTSLPPPCRC